VLYGSIALLVAAHAWAVGPKAREQGVASYTVAEKDGDKRVSLRGNGGREIGQITVHELKHSLLLELTQPGRAHLEIEWDFAVGRVSVRDLNSGESAQAFAFPEKRAADSPEDPLLLRYRPQVEMAFEALHDVGLDKIRLTETFHKRIRTVRQRDDLARLLAKDEMDPSCTGRQVRGSSISGTRSGCCEAATDDANGQCSNGACWGCCSLLSCDASCALGDYGCFCGITGTACEYTPPPPPPTGGGGGGGTGGGSRASCNEGDLVTPEQCVTDCGGYVDGQYCYVP